MDDPTPTADSPTMSASLVNKNLESLEILKALVDGPSSGATSGSCGFEAARKESVAGFRPKANVSAVNPN